jgi:hypothetical protein
METPALVSCLVPFFVLRQTVDDPTSPEQHRAPGHKAQQHH